MIRIPDPGSYSVVADWVELHVLTSGELVSKASLSHLLESESGADVGETFISDVWRELTSRMKRYEKAPFVVDKLAVERVDNGVANNVCLACLLISLFGVGNGSEKAAKLFERVTCCALKSYLLGEGIVFGWPVEKGEKPSIRDRIIEMAGRLKERYVEAPAPKYKDRGVDAIGWKPFSEGRPSQIVVLLQCAAGQDWRKKTQDLPLDAWIQYIHWSCNPIKAFAVPGIIPEGDWHEVSKEGGILFDRIRIVNLTRELTKQDKILGKELYGFVKKRLSEVN